MTDYSIHTDVSPHGLKNEVGSRLAKIRLARNITQKSLAQDAGIALRTLRNLELGKSSTIDSFLRVVIALGYADELLGVFPLHDVWPIERMDSHRNERKRARPDKSQSSDKPWSWGESQDD